MTIDTSATTPDVTAAQELEGLVALDHKNDMAVIRKVERFNELSEQIAALTDKKRELRDNILASITDKGAQALMLDGSVIARRSEVTTTSMDTKGLRDVYPAIYAKFVRKTKSVRLTVGK